MASRQKGQIPPILVIKKHNKQKPIFYPVDNYIVFRILPFKTLIFKAILDLVIKSLTT